MRSDCGHSPRSRFSAEPEPWGPGSGERRFPRGRRERHRVPGRRGQRRAHCGRGIVPKNTRRDTHLRSADFFDSANYPDITFTAEAIRPAGRGVAVTGALTVRGRTQPLTFDAAASVHGDGEVWLDAEVHINRADFGLTWNLMGMVSVHSTLIIHATFTWR